MAVWFKKLLQYLDFPKNRGWEECRWSCSKLSKVPIKGVSSFLKSAESDVEMPSAELSISWFKSIVGDSLKLLKIKFDRISFAELTFFSKLSIFSNRCSRRATYLPMGVIIFHKKRCEDFTLSRDQVSSLYTWTKCMQILRKWHTFETSLCVHSEWKCTQLVHRFPGISALSPVDNLFDKASLR